MTKLASILLHQPIIVSKSRINVTSKKSIDKESVKITLNPEKISRQKDWKKRSKK